MSLSTTMTAFTPFNNDTLLKTVSSKTSSSLLSLWSGLNAVWQPIMGYKAEDFEFVQGKTAFSTSGEMVGMIALYVVVIFGGREYMRDKKPLQLNTLFKIHNFILSVFSGALLALFLEQLVPTLWKEGFYDTICDSPGWTPQLVTLYYLNYITKYVELIDTVFLMAKKKPLTFLHTYHHPATALLCYTQLTGRTPVSWVPITLNLAVHVIMYWYYFQSARGLKVWWKEWITRFQITQFVIDLFVVYYASWNGLAHKYWPSAPHKGYCGGETYAAACGCLILSSYLVLFILFYIATYKRASKRAASKAVKPNPGAIAIAAQEIVDTAKQSVDAAKTSAVGMVNDGMDRNAPLMVEN